MNYEKPTLILLLIIISVISVACSAASEAPVAVADEALAQAETPTTAAPTLVVTPTMEQPTETPLPPTNTPEPETGIDLAMELPAGEWTKGILAISKYNCSSCHTTGAKGPKFSATDELPPIMERGEMRITDPAYTGNATTAREYIIESILSPAAYEVAGDWSKTMPDSVGEEIDEQELAHILAWLETFSEEEEPATATPEPQAVSEPGDPVRGEEIFTTGGDVLSNPCSRCHTLDGSELTKSSAGPSLQGVASRAVERVPGLSAEEYFIESIVDPSAYLAEGYKDSMAKTYKWQLNEEDIADLVAFLLAQE